MVCEERVTFDMSGHRGSAFKRSFTKFHVLAIARAILEYRAMENITGPFYLGTDTHALSEPAFASVLKAGSPPARPALRTYTNFTPKASEERPSQADSRGNADIN